MASQFTPDFTPSFARKKEQHRQTVDVSNLENLQAFAQSKGLKVEKDKPSLFRRTIDLLSRFNYMSANIAKDLVDGGEFKPLVSGWRGLSGKDKTTYSDVLGDMGVQNKILKGGLGFVLDVALDPMTYFGGAMVKGAGKVGKTALKPVGKGIKKVAPDFANHMIDAGTSIADAFGGAFKHGFKTTPGIIDDLGRALNRIGIAKEEVVDKYVKAFAPLNAKEQKQFAETLISNRKKIRAYEKPRVEELIKDGTAKSTEEALIIARREAQEKFTPKFSSKAQEQVFSGLKLEIDNLAKTAGLNDYYKIDAYYPIMDIDQMNKAATMAKVFDQSKAGYLREYRDKIAVDKTVKNPIEAYSRVTFEAERNAIAKQTLNDAVNTYGLNKSSFAKLGEKSVDDLKALADNFDLPTTGLENSKEGLVQLIKGGLNEIKDKTMGGKTIGYLKKRDANFINDSLFPEFKTIDLLARASGYDKMTRWFKTAVTSWFPAFHARNFISGVAQSYSKFGRDAFNPQTYNTALGVMKKGVNKPLQFKNWSGTTQELRAIIRENFEGSSRYISDLSNYIDEIGTNKFSIGKIKDPGRKLGNWIETYHKVAGTIIGLKQGKTLNRAIKMAEEAAFDYRKITKFEAKIMRRLIPFYTFMRKNAGLQLDTFKYHPERIINQAKFANGLSEMFGGKVTEEDVKGLPDWVLDGLGFKIQGDKYVSQFGLPLEEFIETFNSPLTKSLTSMNPIIKYPLESKMGYDFFREQEIVEIDKVAPATGEKLWNLQTNGQLPPWLEDTINLKRYKYNGEYRYSASPKVLHVMRNLPTARIQNTLERLFDGDMDAVNKWSAFFSGMKIYDIDLEMQKYYKEKDLRKDIENQLLNIGEGEQFKTFYIYK